MPALLGVLVAVAFLAVLTHEAEHVAGGLGAGFRFQWLIVGPFRLAREAGRMRLVPGGFVGTGDCGAGSHGGG